MKHFANACVKNNVIPFEPMNRLVEKAREYTESIELFMEEPDQAVPLLMRALKHADEDTRMKIVLLLSCFAREQTASFLLDILHDPNEAEDFRNFVAIQLSNVIPFSEDPEPLVERLLSDIRDPNPEVRINAASALAWEGNLAAAIPLVELLFDSDEEVRQCAVTSISRLGDDGVYPLLLDRLENGPPEQQQCVLFNLWHFDAKKEQTRSVYLKYIEHPDPDLRMDAFVLLRMVSEPGDHPETYRKCMTDPNPRIRELAAERLEEFPSEIRAGFVNELKQLLSDTSPNVRKAAIAVLKMTHDI